MSSTEAPSHTFAGHGNSSLSRSARSGRFVSTWNWCRDAAAIASKTRRMCETPKWLWNTSDMLFTNTRRGRRQERGSRRRSSQNRGANGSARFAGVSRRGARRR